MATVGFTLTRDACTGEEDAIARIEARGWHPLTLDVPAEEIGWHRHDFDAVLFFVDGTLHVELEDGTTLECGPSSILEAPKDVVHRESSSGYRMVVGLSVPVEELTQPINKLVTRAG